MYSEQAMDIAKKVRVPFLQALLYISRGISKKKIHNCNVFQKLDTIILH